MTPDRHYNRWTINEVLSLQREYELLEWTVQDIAMKHQRSVRAILCKLEAEGFIRSWDDARGFNSKEYQNICDGAIDEESVAEFDDDNDDDYIEDEAEDDETLSIDDKESDVDRLTERVWNLETSVKDIGTMVSKMFNSWVTKKATKREPLRKY
jgi:hypothetical protein